MNNHQHSAHAPSSKHFERKSRRSYWVFGGFAVIAGMLLAFEHRAHLSGLAGWLPYLILLACPLMHIFMHGGHGHGGHADESKGEPK